MTTSASVNEDGNMTAMWLLRSSGHIDEDGFSDLSTVALNGVVFSVSGINIYKCGIRPALWVNVSDKSSDETADTSNDGPKPLKLKSNKITALTADDIEIPDWAKNYQSETISEHTDRLIGGGGYPNDPGTKFTGEEWYIIDTLCDVEMNDKLRYKLDGSFTTKELMESEIESLFLQAAVSDAMTNGRGDHDSMYEIMIASAESHAEQWATYYNSNKGTVSLDYEYSGADDWGMFKGIRTGRYSLKYRP
ncbi:MAG: hypothetical protein HUJ76_09350 [Parasporobacterium sp.]|nr:hypothetical protein [Parasporobacterium sp.]